MEKLVIVLTSNFPFGAGESFFATELPYLKKHFGRMVILARNRDQPQTCPVPEGVELHRFPRIGAAGKLRYFKIPFMSEFWRELANVKRNGQAKVTLRLVRNLISFMIHGLSMERQLAGILKQHGKLKDPRGVVLYAYWMEFPVYAALRVKQSFPGMKVVCRAHGCDLYWERHALPYLPLRTYIAEHVDAACFISEQGRDYFMRKNAVQNRGQLKVAKLGVKPVNKRSAASNDGVFRVLSCASAVRVKRLDLIVRALSHIHDFKLQWTHIGDGPELAELKSTAESLLAKSANVKYEFKGALSNEAVYDYYENHCVDILINVSSSEGLPVSMMEAFAFGVPVLATAVGGVPEMVNKENGVLLNPDAAPEEIARAIMRLKHLPADETGNLRNNAWQTWRRFHDATVNYESFAEDLAAAPVSTVTSATSPSADIEAAAAAGGTGR